MRTALVVGVLVSGCTGGMLAPDYAAIRGANYVPSHASTSVAAWKTYDPAQIDRELDYAARLGLNSLRVFLQYVVYEDDPAAFTGRVGDFVARCHRRGIRPLFVLFDSCFGDEPSLGKAESPTWVNNPGFSRLGNRPALERYVREVVAPFRGDPRVLGWDVMNEPMADFNHVTRAERDAIWEFVRHFCAFVKRVDPTHPITVGEAVVEYIPKTSDQVDFISVHSYAADPADFRKDLDLARHYGRSSGKPVVVTECGNPGAGQRYEMVFDVLAREKLGFYFWELMIGKIQFREMAGLIYPDGTTREPSAVAALLRPLGMGFGGQALPGSAQAGFEKKENGIRLVTPPDESALRAFLEKPDRWPALLERARSAPRTKAGITPLLQALTALGRLKGRPGPRAMEIFEGGLTIVHLFRLGRDAEAAGEYEALLSAVEAAVGNKKTGAVSPR
jgi:cellulase (glycosyl hydrolase family 5)